MHYVYLLQSESNPNQSYTGYTSDLRQRLSKHNSSGDLHTSKYKPWRIEAYFAFPDKITPLNFELYLKSASGRAFAKKRFRNSQGAQS
ncbi:MAG: GIY-YIG nuclease family protein [Myxococcota bacterium]